MLSLTSATSGYSATSTSSFRVSFVVRWSSVEAVRDLSRPLKPTLCVPPAERSQLEREAGGDGDLQRHPVPAGGHAAEIL